VSEPITHLRAFELLPWLANGSLPADEREVVEQHVRNCLSCHRELKEQQRLRAALRALPAVQISAQSGFEKLSRQLSGAPALPISPRRWPFAALTRFARYGFRRTSMEDIAAEAGVSRAALYLQFRNKEEILAAVRTAAFDRFASALEGAMNKARGDLHAQGQAVGEAYVRFALGEPEAYRLMFDLSQPHPDRYPELVRATAHARHLMSASLEGLVKAGIFAGDPQLMGHVFWATMHGLVVLYLAGKLPAKPDFRTIQREAMRLLVAGARSGATAPRSRAAASRRKRAS